jgi:hypothetical protein
MQPETPNPGPEAGAARTVEVAVQLALRPSLHPVLDPQRLSALAEASARELIRQG